MGEIGLSHRPDRKPNGITKEDRNTRKPEDLFKWDFTAEKPLEKCVADINPDRGGLNSGDIKFNVINKPFILKPNQVYSMSYIVISIQDSMNEIIKALKYAKTKFTRFLIRTTLSGIYITNKSHIFVPYENFALNSDIDWLQSISEIDQQLYKKYNLTQEEIDYIEKTIKTME